MVFKKLLGSLGVGGPSVDTILPGGPVLPGGTLSGQVHLEGGGADADIEHITLELVARVEAEHAEGESEGVVVFDRGTVAGGFRLRAGERHVVDFAMTLPWQSPVTELYGQPLGIAVGVRTEVAVAGARDKGDLDLLTVGALPVQEALLDALGRLGFGFASADLEYGHISGTGQELPFYQEIELTPPPHLASVMNEIEVTFLAGPAGVEIVLEADKHGGLFDGGHDALSRHAVSHDSVSRTDWVAEAEAWVQELIGHRTGHLPPPGPYPQGGGFGYGGGYPHKEDFQEHDEHHSGPGVGTAVAAGAAGLAVGVVGGLVAAEVVDEVGDFFEGDDEGEDDEGEEG